MQCSMYPIQLTRTIKIRVAVQLIQAITFLHFNHPPLAHLDIKPSNVLVRNALHINYLQYPVQILVLRTDN